MVGLLQKFKGGGAREADIESYLDTLGVEEGDLLEEHADMWVRPMALDDVSDVERVSGELRKGNIVLLNIEPLYKKNNVKLRQAVSELKGSVHDLNGDIARLSETKVLLTPGGVKITKK
ncbi:cell division protein SepF [archaeon]|nr:cell division protein SepF [archaeon]